MAKISRVFFSCWFGLYSLACIVGLAFVLPILVQIYIEKNKESLADLNNKIPTSIKIGIILYAAVPVPFLTALVGATALAAAMGI